jgi:hypothetical protein
VSNDLVVLAADRNLEFGLKGLLSRPQAFGIRPVVFQIHVHPHRDPGCLLESETFLRPFHKVFRYGLVIFDRVGSGKDHLAREELEKRTEQRLFASGWAGRAAVVVLDPELEAWVWTDSSVVDDVLGWSDRHPDLRTWMRDRGLLEQGYLKPQRPKEAVEAALREVRKPRSSALYQALAGGVDFANCSDPSFGKLREKLQAWFGR